MFFIYEGGSEEFLYLFFSFLSILDTLLLHCDSKTCTHFLYMYWGCYYILSPISSCVVSFLSLYTCFLFIVCNILFLFHTKMPWWVLFKVFQKYKLSKSFLPWTLFLQSFSRVCVRIRFYCIQQMIRSCDLWFSHASFVCCGFVMDCQRGRLLGHM